MFKRLGIFFILLANIMIMAHAFVPHHHHDGNVVAIVQDGHIHEHNHSDSHHDSNSPHREDCKITDSLAGAVQRIQKLTSPDNSSFLELLFIVPEACELTPVVIEHTMPCNPEIVPSIRHIHLGAIQRRGPPENQLV